MRSQYVMFLGLILATGTIISLIFGGAWMDSTDTSVTNALTVFKQVDILGIWSIMVPNISFFVTGAKALTSFDFAFFNGGLQILQWFFMLTLGLGFIWGVYTVIISVAQGVFKR
jgi:hypothetical protein